MRIFKDSVINKLLIPRISIKFFSMQRSRFLAQLTGFLYSHENGQRFSDLWCKVSTALSESYVYIPFTLYIVGQKIPTVNKCRVIEMEMTKSNFTHLSMPSIKKEALIYSWNFLCNYIEDKRYYPKTEGRRLSFLNNICTSEELDVCRGV